MIFGGSARSTRGTALIVGAVVFILAFIGLIFNHLDSWHLPATLVASVPDVFCALG